MLEELEEVEKTDSPSTNPTAATDPSGNLLKWLKYMENEKTAIVELTRTLAAEFVPHTRVCAYRSARIHQCLKRAVIWACRRNTPINRRRYCSADSSDSYRPIKLLRRCELSQKLTIVIFGIDGPTNILRISYNYQPFFQMAEPNKRFGNRRHRVLAKRPHRSV